MVIPLNLGGAGPTEDQETPEKIKNTHFIGWYIVSFLFIVTAIGCIVALKIFDALIALIVGIWAYYIVKKNCENMSQQCLFSFGLMCVMQAVLEFIILAMSLPGRRTQSTTTNGEASPHAAPSPFMGGHSHTSSYTVTTKTSPFFSEEEGWHYNLQSAMMIAMCVVFIIGAIMSKISYSEYPNSLFDDPGESRQFGGSAYGSGNYSSGPSGGGRYYGGGAPPARPTGSQNWGGGQRLGGGSNNQMFGGSGQRLGSA